MGSPCLIICIIAVVFIEASFAFLPHQCVRPSLHRDQHIMSVSRSHPVRTIRSTLLAAKANSDTDSAVEITFSTPEAAASMGIRDWPQQFRSSSWTDSVEEGGIATRYILEGRGRVTVDYYDDAGELGRVNNRRVYPGTLVEVDGEANLLWEVDDENEGKLVVVGGFLLMFCAGLLIGSGGL